MHAGMKENEIEELCKFERQIFCKRRNGINHSADILFDSGSENGVPEILFQKN